MFNVHGLHNLELHNFLRVSQGLHYNKIIISQKRVATTKQNLYSITKTTISTVNTV